MWNASHLAVRLCALRHWKRVPMPPTTQSLRHPLTRAHHIAPRINTARRFTASGFYPFDDATALAGESGVGDVAWLIQASASNHKPKGRFFWYAFGIYKPKEPSLCFAFGLWFMWFA